MLRCRDITFFIGAALLAGCSGETAGCESFDVELILFSDLEKRFPNKVGTNLEAKDWVDSSQFTTKCLYLQHPQYEGGMDYAETRESGDGNRIYLFTPLGVTDTRIGFIRTENNVDVVVVGML